MKKFIFNFKQISYTNEEYNQIRTMNNYQKISNGNSDKYTTKYIDVDPNKIVGKSSSTENDAYEQHEYAIHIKKQQLHEIKEKTLKIATNLSIFNQVHLGDAYYLIKDQRLQKYTKGQTILSTGEKTDRLYFLVNGSIDVITTTNEINTEFVKKKYAFINVKSFITESSILFDTVSTSDNTQIFSFIINELYIDKLAHIYKKIYLNISNYIYLNLHKSGS